ncbi:MAG: UPF0262 family protein [Bdellovibrionales bacterium]
MKRSIVYIDLITDKRCQPSSAVRRERDNAIADLLQENVFEPVNDDGAPYHVELGIKDQRLIIEMVNAEKIKLPTLILSLRPYKRLIKDYFIMVESYNDARHLGGDKLEAIDMGRRAVHNEGASYLKERLSSKVNIDMETARRLFTLICVLHIGQVRGPQII